MTVAEKKSYKQLKWKNNHYIKTLKQHPDRIKYPTLPSWVVSKLLCWTMVPAVAPV